MKLRFACEPRLWPRVFLTVIFLVEIPVGAQDLSPFEKRLSNLGKVATIDITDPTVEPGAFEKPAD